MSDSDSLKILAITGGVGGAKLALGLSKVLPPEALMFAVNTGDDFEHLGLHISPDIDSLTYALAEQNNTETGWGRVGETWQFIETLDIPEAGKAAMRGLTPGNYTGNATDQASKV